MRIWTPSMNRLREWVHYVIVLSALNSKGILIIYYHEFLLSENVNFIWFLIIVVKSLIAVAAWEFFLFQKMSTEWRYGAFPRDVRVNPFKRLECMRCCRPWWRINWLWQRTCFTVIFYGVWEKFCRLRKTFSVKNGVVYILGHIRTWTCVKYSLLWEGEVTGVVNAVPVNATLVLSPPRRAQNQR